MMNSEGWPVTSRTSTDVSIPIRNWGMSFIPELADVEWLGTRRYLVPQPSEERQVDSPGPQGEAVAPFQQLQLVAGRRTECVQYMRGQCDLAF